MPRMGLFWPFNMLRIQSSPFQSNTLPSCVILIGLLSSFLLHIVCAEDECLDGLSTPGYTIPKGDIVLEYGNPLDITCILMDSFISRLPPNTSFGLTYHIHDKPVPPEWIRRINDTAIQLHIDRPEKTSTVVYNCMVILNASLGTANSTEMTLACPNIVAVGVKPQLVTDFNCISFNYDNLTCEWTPPENFIKTDYNLTYYLPVKALRYAHNMCPHLKYSKQHINYIKRSDQVNNNGSVVWRNVANIPNNSKEKMSCMWNISTSPQYRQVHKEFYFILTMTNQLGVTEINKTFMHFQNVLSGPPENLTALRTTPNSILLYYMVPSSMISFPPGVHHRILYQCEYGDKKWQFGGLILNQTHSRDMIFNLTNLPYAHALCDIRVSLRAVTALASDESMWSNNASITVRTNYGPPELAPPTTMGSFEIVSFGRHLQHREAYIYWQQIDDKFKNGPQFRYAVTVTRTDKRTLLTLQPVELTHAYAKYQNLSIFHSYTFYIYSENIAGRSRNFSKVTIPRQLDRPPEVISFTKVDFGNGKYEVSWEPSKVIQRYHQKHNEMISSNNVSVSNYTIFWCSNTRDRPYQCTGKLFWRIVDSALTSHNETITSSNNDKTTHSIYQFAIAVNAKSFSSGMLWAACTVLHNKTIGKMKDVWINRLGSTFIEVGWKLDCSDRIGSVIGYIIYYCPIKSPVHTECKGPQRNVTLYDSDRRHQYKVSPTATLGGANITNLLPYTTYMLTVSVIGKHNMQGSQQSDPLFNTTLEAAPSTPPLNVHATNITNTTISLIWQPPPITNGMLKTYHIRYNDIERQIVPSTSAELVNLESYTLYSIQIRACTTMCSNWSESINITTTVGFPGVIRTPSVGFQNDSLIKIIWNQPTRSGGKTDLYEVRVRYRYLYDNRTEPIFNSTSSAYTIENCGDNGKYNTFYTSVRAVNIVGGESYRGPWSDELEWYCRTPANYLLYFLFLLGIIFLTISAFFLNRAYRRCKFMRDVEVKLPPGLSPVTSENQARCDALVCETKLALGHCNGSKEEEVLTQFHLSHYNLTPNFDDSSTIKSNLDSQFPMKPIENEALLGIAPNAILETIINDVIHDTSSLDQPQKSKPKADSSGYVPLHQIINTGSNLLNAQ